MVPEALLLDFDGTLVDWFAALESGVEVAAEHFAREHGLDPREVARRTLAFEAEVFDAHVDGWCLGDVGAFELHSAVWRRAHEEFGVEARSTDALAHVHWQAELAAMRAYDDVAQLLRATAAHGIRTALVTNGPGPVQRAKLDRVGLTDAFDAVLVSAEVGSAKPDARIFHAALAELGVAPENAWHVGDTLAFDIAGARAAGVGAVWLNRGGLERGAHEAEPHYEIAALHELTALFARAA